MKPSEILRTVADKMDQFPEIPGMWGFSIPWARGQGRFPFAGGGTELLCDLMEGPVYAVPAERILSVLAKYVKEFKALPLCNWTRHDDAADRGTIQPCAFSWHAECSPKDRRFGIPVSRVCSCGKRVVIKAAAQPA